MIRRPRLSILIAVHVSVLLAACAPASPAAPPAQPTATPPTAQVALPSPVSPTLAPTLPPPTVAPTAVPPTATPAPTATSVPQPTATPVAAEVPITLEIAEIKLVAPVKQIGLVTDKDGSVAYGLPVGRAVGWYEDSAKLGEGGNVVMDGHHNIDGKVFERLNELKVGSRVVIKGRQREVTYEIKERMLLLQRGQPMSVLLEQGKLLLQDGQDKITLVTCWPAWDNSHRLVLIGTPVQSRLLTQAASGG